MIKSQLFYSHNNTMRNNEGIPEEDNSKMFLRCLAATPPQSRYKAHQAVPNTAVQESCCSSQQSVPSRSCKLPECRSLQLKFSTATTAASSHLHRVLTSLGMCLHVLAHTHTPLTKPRSAVSSSWHLCL